MAHFSWLRILPAALLVALTVACSSNAKTAGSPTTTTSTTSSSATTSTTAPATGAATTSTTVAAGGPLPAGFGVEDLTWVSDTDGWALGNAPCAHAPCTSMAHTVNGGQTWAGLPAPVAYSGTSFALGNCSATVACVDGVRFANTTVGYVFGQSSLWLTTNGGHTWTERSRDTTNALEVDGSLVVRVTNPNNATPPGISYQVQTTTVGSTSWHTVLGSTVEGDGVLLAVQGPDLYLAVVENPAGGAQDEHPTLYRSTNSGATWSTLADPCGNAPSGNEADTSALAAAPGGYLVVACTARQAGETGYVVVSADAGASFGPQRANLLGTQQSTATKVAAATGQRLVVLVGSAISVSNDGGVNWTVTYTEANPPAVSPDLFLGFEDALTGRAVLSPGTILTTTDGGGHWTPYTFPT